MDAGVLRYRVEIQELKEVQDDGGSISKRWQSKFRDVPAGIEPLSVREFIAAQQVQGEVAVRVTIRYRSGITSKMRVKHGKTIYAIVGPPLSDADDMATHLTLMCSAGVNEGE